MSDFEDELIPDPKKSLVDRVLELAKQNLSYAEIATLVGRTRQRVSQICLENGIVRRPSDIKVENWQAHWDKLEEN